MLNEEQSLRYSRNIALPEIEKQGQETMLDSHVAVIGAGGLGAMLTLQLAASGVGNITVIDSDRVELSNLQRQIAYTMTDIGHPKVKSLQNSVEIRNPDCTIHTIKDRVTAKNAITLLDGVDVIADGSDNFATRFAINEAAYALKTPLVSAAVTGWDGQISTYKAYESKDAPCFRCFCPHELLEDEQQNCSRGGVVGSVAGMMASIQATEVMKELLLAGDSLSGWLLRYDGLKARWYKSALKKVATCPVCAQVTE